MLIAQRPVSTAMPSSYFNHHQKSHLQQDIHRERSGSGSIMPSATLPLPAPPPPAPSSGHHANIRHNTAPASSSSRSQQQSQSNLPPQINGQSSTTMSASSSTTSNGNSSTNTSTNAPPPFQPITINQVLAAHGHDVNQALTGLLGNFNAVLQDRDNDKHERTRLNNENSKLWSWTSNLKKERDAVKSDLRALSSRMAELESLLSNTGIQLPPHLQQPLQLVSASLTTNVNTSSRLSPSDSLTASTFGRDGDAEQPHITQRRPSPGPRSISDNTATIASMSRERQASNRSAEGRERNTSAGGVSSSSSSGGTGGTGTVPTSQSMNSFTTASSFSDSGHVSSGASSLMGSGAGRRGHQQQQQLQPGRSGASTPPVGTQKTLTPQMYPSPLPGASPGRIISSSSNSSSRDGTSQLPHQPQGSSSTSPTSLPPLSSSANFQSELGMTPSGSKVGLATIPSTPLVNGAEFPQDASHMQGEGQGQIQGNSGFGDGLYAGSPLSGQFNLGANRSDRSDTASVEHLRIAKSSPLPSSPALSTHSGTSSFQPSQHSGQHSSSSAGIGGVSVGGSGGGTSSQQASPRSPRFAQVLSSSSPAGMDGPFPLQPSPRHASFAHSMMQQGQSSSSSSPVRVPSNASYHHGTDPSIPPVPGQRKLSRKASSLDLTNRDAVRAAASSNVQLRAATPPPDIGSPKIAGSPTQYAFAPKTPPAGVTRGGPFDSHLSSHTGTPSSRTTTHGTPMMDLPDEARNWILANGGSSLPSPVTPLDVATVTTRLGGLGISSNNSNDMRPTEDTASGLHADTIAASRQRKVSNALQAVSNGDGRSYPSSGTVQRSLEYGIVAPVDAASGSSSTTAGVLQDAYEPSLSEEPLDYPREQQYHQNTQPLQYQQPPSAMKPSRPNGPDRSRSDHSSERPRAYTAGSSHSVHTGSSVTSSQYATQPLSYRQGGDRPLVLPLQQPPKPAHQRSRDDYGNPQAGAAPNYGTNGNTNGPPLKCVPLVPGLLSAVSTDVVTSNIKIADRGREVVSFHIRVAISRQIPRDDPRHALIAPNVPTGWIIEKTWNDLLNLDHTIRTKNSKSSLRKLLNLPDKHLFRDHAPSRVDQRKSDLQKYLQCLCHEDALTDRTEFCVFLTNNIVSDRTAPVSNPGYKAGYLTKKGRNFGGWTTRYYVLQGRMLEYYDTPGGQHLGSIDIKAANIGRQNSKPSSSGDDSIRHAFLIRAKDKTGEETDHILCAESDEERDHWVNMLVCCLTGEYVPDTIASIPIPSGTTTANSSNTATTATATASTATTATISRPPQPPTLEKLRQTSRKGSREIEITRGAAQPISQLSHDANNQKLFGGPSYNDATPKPPGSDNPRDIKHRREMSAGQSSTASGPDDNSSVHRVLRRNQHGSDLPGSTSMPANLDQMSNSDSQSSMGQTQSTSHKFAGKNSLASGHNDSGSESGGRPRSPDKRMKISGPSGGMPIGSDFKRSKEDRRNKVKSSFWDFAGRRIGDRRDANATPARPVFGVPIQEAVEIARVKEDSDLPAVVFRCVQYLSSVKAEKEEGIYRMSGSSAVIKALKDRFNAEGDVDLTSEYFDPHAIAGLLKQFFRELPVHIFTSELNPDFIRANEIEEPRAKIKEVTRLVQLLPVANYSALRFLSAHLVNIIKSEHINKMNVKNMGIVFSPTLAVPATLFTLFINEFDRIFREMGDDEDEEQETVEEDAAVRERRGAEGTGHIRRRSRNSVLFVQSGADRLLEDMYDPEIEGEDDPYQLQGDRDGQGRGYTTNDDTLRARNQGRHNLTIDVTNAPNANGLHEGHYGQQKSPSASSASSPRFLYPHQPIRSPGLPASPRNVEGFLPRRT